MIVILEQKQLFLEMFILVIFFKQISRQLKKVYLDNFNFNNTEMCIN